MFSKAIEKISNSIFPIISTFKLPNNTSKIQVLGTGFFITDNGIFMTANHVMNQNPPDREFLYFGSIPNITHKKSLKIKKIYSDPLKDIYIGKIDGNKVEPVEFGISKPKIGTSICMCGYPLPRMKITPKGIDLHNVRKYWQPTFVVDYYNIDNRNTFITQHTSLSGMSGGPAFGINGIVYGMDIQMFTRKIMIPNQGPLLVRNGIVLTVEELKNAIEQCKTKLNRG